MKYMIEIETTQYVEVKLERYQAAAALEVMRSYQMEVI